MKSRGLRGLRGITVTVHLIIRCRQFGAELERAGAKNRVAIFASSR